MCSRYFDTLNMLMVGLEDGKTTLALVWFNFCYKDAINNYVSNSFGLLVLSLFIFQKEV